MALIYDNNFGNAYLQEIRRYDSTTSSFSANLVSSSSFDFFSDSAAVGDCFYLLAYDVRAFRNLRIYVGTAFSATSVTFVWEYSSGLGVWSPLSNVVNGDAFKNTGQQDITWDIPRNWEQTSRHSSGVNLPKQGGWIRARISAIDTPTEGGAQSTQTVQVGRNLLVVTSGSESFSSIRSSDVSNGWGITDATPSGTSIQLYASLTINSKATLADSNKAVEVINSRITNNGTITLGTYSSTYDYSYNGWFLYLKSFGYGGGHDHFGGGGVYNFYGGIIRVLYPGRIGIFESSVIRDTLIEGYYQTFVCNNTTIDRLRADSLVENRSTPNIITEMWTKSYFLLGQQQIANVTAENITASYVEAWSVYVARNIFLINPTLLNANPLIVLFFALGGGDHDVYFYTQFRFDLKVIDNEASAISGANVVIKDLDGETVFSGTTDGNGNISQQVLTQKISFFDDPNLSGGSVTKTTPDSITYKTPHTVTISKKGYQTKTVKYTMDRRREEVEVLEPAIDVLTPMGERIYKNLKPEDGQNKTLWLEIV